MPIRIPCPHCQQTNPADASICQGCGGMLENGVTGTTQQPEQTARTRNPTTGRGLIARLKRWWKKRGRRAI